jgi:hypothetical protein
VPVQDTLLDSGLANLPNEESSGASLAPPQKTLKHVIDVVLLTGLFFVPAYMTLHSSALGDFDIWWHLRAGEWISAHHAVPHTELFSRPMAGTPWLAYSWLFELLTFKLFTRFGLQGLLIYTSSLILLITVALFSLIRRNHRQVPAAAFLTFACMFSMGHLYTPRPWLFTILFFTLELDILLEVRRTGHKAKLLWLPVIFAFWSNIHIQFVDGLFVFGLAVAESIASRWWPQARTKAAAGPLLAALVASLLATLANPYGWRIYAVAHELATQTGALDRIGELQAIPFRDLINYLALVLALGSAAALGWSRRIVSFEGALLVFAAILSFRSQRDAWVIAIVGAAIVSRLLPETREPRSTSPKYLTLVAGTVAAVALAGAFRCPELTNSKLHGQLAQELPVQAVDFVREHRLQGPLFNDFNWGGYFVWNLRMPVSIDGRQNVYGDERIDRNIATWSGSPAWQQNSELAAARLVIGPATSPLTQILRRSPRFQLVYEDQVAAVFIARN